MKKSHALAAIVAALPGMAFAGFELESATTEENAVSMEIENTIFFGDVNAGDTLSEHEIGFSWGVLNPWTTSLSFEIQTEQGGSPALEGIEWSNTFGVVGGEASVSEELAVAIYTSLELDFESSDDISLTVGPTLEYEIGSVELGLNTFVEIPLGGGEDAGFVYAVGAASEVTEGMSVGLELHGEIEEAFSNAADLDQQSHFAGPVVEIETGDDAEQGAEIRVGVFAGLTDVTPSVAVSANVGFDF